MDVINCAGNSNPCATETLRDVYFHKPLLNNIRSLYKSELLCDVTIIASKVEIKAHKLVLAAASQYFRGLFTSGIGGEKNVIKMHSTEGAALKAIVDYFYTGEIELSEESALSVMEVEDLLGVGGSLRSLLSRFVKSRLNDTWCWGPAATAELFGYKDLADSVYLYIRENFNTLIVLDDFLQVPSYLLSRCLDSDHLVTPPQDVFLQRLCAWAGHDKESRLGELAHMLECVDATRLASPQESVSSAKELLGEAAAPLLDRFLSLRGAVTSTHIYCPSLLHVVFAIGGRNGGRTFRSSECLSSGVNPWRLSLPLQVTGANVTVPVALMTESRAGHAVTSTLHRIYVLGGGEGEAEKGSCTGEVYDVKENIWRPLPRLPAPLSDLSLASMEASLYATGGILPNLESSNSTWVLGEKSKIWKEVTPMLEARHNHGSVTVDGILYVIGGYGCSGETLDSVERYDPVCQTWSSAAHMLTGRAGAGCVAVGHYIYVIGGYTNRTQDEKYHERFDTVTNKWERFGKCSSVFGCERSPGIQSVAFGRNIVSTGGGTHGLGVEALDTSSRQSMPIGSTVEARAEHALASLRVPVRPLPPI